MTRSDRCPTHEELTGLALGTLDEDSAEVVLEHLDHCAACEATYAGIDTSTDPLHAALRWDRQVREYAQEPACRDVLDVVREFGREPSFLAAAAGPSAAPPSPDLGTIRDYRLLAKLGEGGMGTVYKALHTQLEKVVALKLLPARRMRSGAAVERFRREMKAVGRLDHVHIVRALDAGEEAGRYYLAMEYVEGLDLSEVVRRAGPLPVGAACELVRQAALGLQEAHAHGMVHRDVKPSNLMLVTKRGRPPLVKLLDLGLARLEDRPHPAKEDLTTTGQFMGTLQYMAPEQGLDSHAVDPRADLYALGATLFKLLTGEPPFAGPGYDTPLKLVRALATETIPSLGTRRGDLPPGLVALVDRLLARAPEERCATAAEVVAALEPFCRPDELERLVADLRRQLPPTPVASPALGGSTADTGLHRTFSDRPLPSTVTQRRPAPSKRGPASDAGRWVRSVLVGVVGGMLLCAAIVIVIRDKDGREQGRLSVPDGSRVEITTTDGDRPRSPTTPVVPPPREPAPTTPAPASRGAPPMAPPAPPNRPSPTVASTPSSDGGFTALGLDPDGMAITFRALGAKDVRKYPTPSAEPSVLTTFVVPPAALPAGPHAADRSAAEWLRANTRCELMVMTSDGLLHSRFGRPSGGRDKPEPPLPAAPYVVLRVRFLETIVGAELAHLQGLTELQEVEVSFSRTDRTAFVGLEQLGASAGLRSLVVNETSPQPRDFAFLRRFPRLERLQIAGCTSRGPDGYAVLGGLRALRWLTVHQMSGAGPTEFQALAGLTNLMKLRLSGCDFDATAAAVVSGFRELAELSVNSTVRTFAAENLAPLAELPKLRQLDLRGRPTAADGFAQIARMSSLVGLYAEGAADADLAQLAALPRLETFTGSSSRITDAAVPILVGMPTLKGVFLPGSRLSQEAKESLRTQRPDLRTGL